MTNLNSDLKNKRWTFVILHLRVSFQTFSNLFEVFTSIHRLFSILSLRWWFKTKNEKVLYVYLIWFGDSNKRSTQASGKSWTENKSVILFSFFFTGSELASILSSSHSWCFVSVIVQVCHLGDELELRIAEARVRWWRFFNESLRTALNSLQLIEIFVTGKVRVCVFFCVLEFSGIFDRNRIERENDDLFLWFWCVGAIWMGLWWLGPFIAWHVYLWANKGMPRVLDLNWFWTGIWTWGLLCNFENLRDWPAK